MALRTFGDKPISFQLEENGEYYCVGSEVSYFQIIRSQNKSVFFRLETIYACLEAHYTKNTLACLGDRLQMKNVDV